MNVNVSMGSLSGFPSANGNILVDSLDGFLFMEMFPCGEEN